MTIQQAISAIKAAGIIATFNPASDESVDDEIILNLNQHTVVQICASRNGLYFCGTFADGEGDDFGVTFGRETRDPVAAARDAIALATA